MATYTVSAGHRALGAWNLTASQVDTVTFADNVREVQVINSGTDDVWVTADGSTPTVPGAHVSTKAMRIPPSTVLDLELRGDVDSVKLVSAGTPSVSVQLLDA